MNKTTYCASTDVALVKYWGKKDAVLRLPENGSISIILDGLYTITTVEFRDDLQRDHILIDDAPKAVEIDRVVKHLHRIRSLAGSSLFANVKSTNSFPKGTGLSSSGSGFAALTYAATEALDLNLSEKELSVLARQGSGTACRCVCGGFVEWKDGNTSETSYSETIFPPSYWDLRDIVVVVDEGMKRVSSTEGHASANSSPFFGVRQERIRSKISSVKQAIERRDFSQLGVLIEAEALEFHTILLTSQPTLIAWYPGTLQVMHEVQQLRREGVETYFTINTGFNVHVITLPENVEHVQERICSLPLVKRSIVAHIGGKPAERNEHLF